MQDRRIGGVREDRRIALDRRQLALAAPPLAFSQIDEAIYHYRGTF